MRNIHLAIAATILLAAPTLARADGPCTDDIATLRKQLANQTGLGGVVSEPAAGTQVGQSAAKAPASGQAGTQPSDRAQGGGASLASGGSPGTVGGVAGPAGSTSGGGTQNAIATGQIATSAQDVRKQSEGKPTAAQQAASGQANDAAQTQSDDKVSQAKMALQRAIDLNASDDASCKSAVTEAKGLLPKGS